MEFTPASLHQFKPCDPATIVTWDQSLTTLAVQKWAGFLHKCSKFQAAKKSTMYNMQ